MDAEEQIARANRAQAILDDPLVVETFAAVEAECVKRWRNGDEEGRSSPEMREAVWQLLKNMETFRGMFAAYIRTGKVAAAEIERKQKAKTADPYG